MTPKKFGKNTTAKILSILFAVILWFNIATNSEYNYKVYIPIKYIEPSSGYMLASIPPEETQVYLKGSGKSLVYFIFKNLVYPGESYISTNLAGLSKGEHRIDLDKENIALSTGESLQVERILNNPFFSVEIDKKIKRTVKVDIDSLPAFKLENNFVLNGKPAANPEFVIIEGPEDIVNTMNSVKVASLDNTMISQEDTLVHARLLDTIRFVTVSQNDVTIHFPVEPLRTKRFHMPVTFINFPRKIRQRINPDTLSVYIQGPESVVSRSRFEDIFISVNYRAYLDQIAQGDSLITPEITYPEGITNVTITPGVLHISDYSSGV